MDVIRHYDITADIIIVFLFGIIKPFINRSAIFIISKYFLPAQYRKSNIIGIVWNKYGFPPRHALITAQRQRRSSPGAETAAERIFILFVTFI
jgi:hypothetical protein